MLYFSVDHTVILQYDQNSFKNSVLTYGTKIVFYMMMHVESIPKHIGTVHSSYLNYPRDN